MADATPEVSSLTQQEEISQPPVGTSIIVESGSLESAVREAEAGDTLRLNAGEHRLSRPLEIDKPLSLIGEGMDNTRVVCDGEAYVVKFVGDGPFVVQDLSFEHQGSRWAEVAEVVGGEIDIRQCRFTGGVLDEAGQGGGVGLVLWGETRGLVANCELVQNGFSGVVMPDRAQTTLEANTCRENLGNGIYYFGSAAGTARRNVCSANEGMGILVGDQAQPILEANTCQENKTGIIYVDSAAGSARQNICSANERMGILVGDQAQPTLEANTCSGNEHFGISVGEQAQPILEANACQQNKQDGIAYTGSAAGTARQNACSANEYEGISVGGHAQPTLEANTCQNNTLHGICYEDSAAGIAGQNICSANERQGIYVGDQAQPTLEANTCQGNKGAGIAYFGSAAGLAWQNVCIANEHSGIYVVEQAHPTLEANTCQESEYGIAFGDSATGIARHNVCSGNEHQILVEPTARPQLVDNRLQETQYQGGEATNQGLQWEYCEMSREAVVGGVSGAVLNMFLNQVSHRLEAIATGPRGRYHVAYAPIFLTSADVSVGGGAMDGEPALAALTDELIRDGWEPIPGGPLWWQARFRRPVQTRP